MKVEGDYHRQGYALVKGLIPPEVAEMFLVRMQADLAASGTSAAAFGHQSPLTAKPTVEIYGHLYQPMATFLWGLTPIMAMLTGRDLLPTYDYFRIYRGGDICRLHADRASCEHSLSLTLGYSDGRPWSFEVGHVPVTGPDYLKESFGEAPHSSLAMEPGDAVLYKGVEYQHGRVTPNPNRWSAHLFLHWVDRNGPYRDHAFDRQPQPTGGLDFAV
jgi:hypothetical protein